MQTSPNYRAALRRACGIAAWRIAPLTIAHRANELHRALDANGNWTRMRNRVIVYARVCMICACACMAPHCGCVWCGRRDAGYAAHMRLRLAMVLSRASWLWPWRAVKVDVITRRKGARACACAWVRHRSGVVNSGCKAS